MISGDKFVLNATECAVLLKNMKPQTGPEYRSNIFTLLEDVNTLIALDLTPDVAGRIENISLLIAAIAHEARDMLQ